MSADWRNPSKVPGGGTWSEYAEKLESDLALEVAAHAKTREELEHARIGQEDALAALEVSRSLGMSIEPRQGDGVVWAMKNERAQEAEKLVAMYRALTRGRPGKTTDADWHAPMEAELVALRARLEEVEREYAALAEDGRNAEAQQALTHAAEKRADRAEAALKEAEERVRQFDKLLKSKIKHRDRAEKAEAEVERLRKGEAEAFRFISVLLFDDRDLTAEEKKWAEEAVAAHNRAALSPSPGGSR